MFTSIKKLFLKKAATEDSIEPTLVPNNNPNFVTDPVKIIQMLKAIEAESAFCTVELKNSNETYSTNIIEVQDLKKQILIDGGPNDFVVDKLGKTLPFYDKKIELIILTHPDKDHISGLVEVVKRYKVDKILTTGIECSTEVCQIWQNEIKKKKIPVKIAQAGQIISIDFHIS